MQQQKKFTTVLSDERTRVLIQIMSSIMSSWGSANNELLEAGFGGSLEVVGDILNLPATPNPASFRLVVATLERNHIISYPFPWPINALVLDSQLVGDIHRTIG